MTINRVNWKEFKRVVENSLVRLQLSKSDIEGSIELIREAIKEVLEIYVQERYRNGFKIEVGDSLGSYEATLSHGATELCVWEGSIA
jgi:hypothetical protein